MQQEERGCVISCGTLCRVLPHKCRQCFMLTSKLFQEIQLTAATAEAYTPSNQRGSNLKVRRVHQRAVSVAIIALFNAAWFFAIGCEALCAFRACPQQSAAEDRCEHQGRPAHQSKHQHSSKCPTHDYFLASTVLRAGPDLTSGLESAMAVAAPASFISLTVGGPLASPAALSHSPPGFSTGRIICQKESLLRI